MDPNLALLTDNRSFCLLLLTTSLAKILADFTSPFAANCLTVWLALLVAISNWGDCFASDLLPLIETSNLPHIPIKLATFSTKFSLPGTNSLFRSGTVKETINGLHAEPYRLG